MIHDTSQPIKKHAVHIAIYRWKKGAPIAQIEEAMDKLIRIADDIPKIQLITWGEKRTDGQKGLLMLS